jgi:hypothetical protein
MDSVESRGDAGMSNDPGSETGGRTSSTVRWLLTVSILANAGLAYGYFELRRDIDGADDRIEESAAEAKDSIEQVAALALAEIPDTDQLESDVTALKKDATTGGGGWTFLARYQDTQGNRYLSRHSAGYEGQLTVTHTVGSGWEDGEPIADFVNQLAVDLYKKTRE